MSPRLHTQSLSRLRNRLLIFVLRLLPPLTNRSGRVGSGGREIGVRPVELSTFLVDECASLKYAVKLGTTPST